MNRCVKCSLEARNNLKTVFYCDDCFLNNIQNKFLKTIRPILQMKNKICKESKYSKLLEKFVDLRVVDCFKKNFYQNEPVDNILIGISMDQYTGLILKNLFLNGDNIHEKKFYPFENITSYELDFAASYYNITIMEEEKDRITIATDEFCEEINKWNYSAFYNIKKLHKKINK